ncbi:MAG: Ig-like domain-containing protein, partial [Planctomycetota bacterium]|nr:Ig-like domain-containing protein [Planctomycetota bacterium]
HIDAGQDITVNLGTEQRIDASSHTSENGPAEASVLIHAGKDIDGPGVISINGGGKNPIHVLAKSGGGAGTAEVYSTDDEADWDETDGEAHAVLEIDENRIAECPECPMPPDLPPPLPPVTVPDEATTHMGDPVASNVLDNDSLPQGGNLTAILMTEPEHGELTEFDFETGEYTYQPDEGYVGTDTFTYIASDGELYAEPITVTITVTNTLPVVEGESSTTHMGTLVNGTIQDNVSDPDGDPFTTALVTDAEHGTLTLNPDGTYSYEPDEGYVGPDSFTYAAADAQIGAEPVEATVTINMTNALPSAEGEELTTHMGVSVDGTIQDNISDVDSDPLTTALVADTEHGVLTLNPDGTYSYQPDEGYVGPDSFTYSAIDGQTNAEPTEATVTITMINALPGLGDDTATTEQDVAVVIDVLANDLDPDGDPLSVDAFIYEGGGILVLNEDGTFTYTPGDGFAGQDSFTYSAADPEAGAEFARANVTIIVNPKPAPAVPTSIAAAPGLEPVVLEISGCPALTKWAAAELGVNESTMQIWARNTLASARGIQPCDACAKLKRAATILQDSGGLRSAALAQVISEFTSGAIPLSEEQDASIIAAIANNYNTNSHYAMAGEYLDSIAAYVGTLNSEMNFSVADSVTFAADRYVAPLADRESDNAGFADFLAARLAALSEL